MRQNAKNSLFFEFLVSLFLFIGMQNAFADTGNLDVMTKNSTYTVNAGDEKSVVYKSGTRWTFVDAGLTGSRVPVYVSAFADGGVDLVSAIGQTYTLTLDPGIIAFTSKTGDTKVTWPKTIGASGIDTIWIYQSLDGLSTSPEEKVISLKSQAKIKFYAPRFDFAEPMTTDDNGKVTAWKHPLTADPDTDEDGEYYFHWIGDIIKLYVLIVNPLTNEICTECQMTPAMIEASSGVTMSGDPILLDNGAFLISIRSRKEYIDSAAYITISSTDDAMGLSLSSYANMHFLKTPAPYPQLVELYDTRGTSLGELDIPEPYYSESKNYLDGKADSLVIYYSEPFSINDQGSISPPLPFMICLDWDENTENLHKK